MTILSLVLGLWDRFGDCPMINFTFFRLQKLLFTCINLFWSLFGVKSLQCY